MSTSTRSTRSARRVAVGAVGVGALTGALLIGTPAVAQAAPAPAVAPHPSVELTGAFSPATAPAGLPTRAGVPDVLPMWGHHHGFGHHHGRHHGHHHGFGHHHHHWWNPWRWFWFW